MDSDNHLLCRIAKSLTVLEGRVADAFTRLNLGLWDQEAGALPLRKVTEINLLTGSADVDSTSQLTDHITLYPFVVIWSFLPFRVSLSPKPHTVEGTKEPGWIPFRCGMASLQIPVGSEITIHSVPCSATVTDPLIIFESTSPIFVAPPCALDLPSSCTQIFNSESNTILREKVWDINASESAQILAQDMNLWIDATENGVKIYEAASGGTEIWRCHTGQQRNFKFGANGGGLILTPGADLYLNVEVTTPTVVRQTGTITGIVLPRGML